MKPDGSLPCLQEASTGPNDHPVSAICNMLVWGWQTLTHPQTWLAISCKVSYTVCSTYSQLAPHLEAVYTTRNLRTRLAVVGRDPPGIHKQQH
jgi:hypothetical protein